MSYLDGLRRALDLGIPATDANIRKEAEKQAIENNIHADQLRTEHSHTVERNESDNLDDDSDLDIIAT